jgi:hypothetical protein
MKNTFPKTSVVYPGCILATISNAIAIIDYGSFPYRTWDEGTYLYDGTDGNLAAITFRDEALVATLFDHESKRSPFGSDLKGNFDTEFFFQGIPAGHRPLADRCLMYCRQQKNEGQVLPAITATFWDAGEYLTAAEPWDLVWNHGANVIENELNEDLDEAFAKWREGTGLTEEGIAFVRLLFQKKMSGPKNSFTLTRQEVDFLKRLALDPRQDEPMIKLMKTSAEWPPNKNSFEVGCQVLASIGIYLG